MRSAGNLSLGSLDHDLKDIEIVRYSSPTILVKVMARYPDGLLPDSDSQTFKDEPRSDIRFAKQDDGRFRSKQLLPDQSVTIHATADGYRERSATLELPEGAVKELELVLDEQ